MSLNGPWAFAIDPGGRVVDRSGREAAYDRRIVVPYPPESRLSGVGETDFMESVWYRRSIDVPAAFDGRRILLHFGAVDWHATVYVDGQRIGEHRGSSAAFAFDITAFVRPGQSHVLTVHAVDRLRDGKQPAGKQSSRPGSWGCYYTRVTGIWQPVWLEATGDSYLTGVAIVPDVAAGAFMLSPSVARFRRGLTFRATARSSGTEIGACETPLQPGVPARLDVPSPKLWAPGAPHLYDLTFEILAQGTVIDRVESYAGLRSIAVEDDRILLNGEPLYMRLVLDQGYYPDGTWTAPDDAALRRDIELAQSLGFNGARLHQKVFEPRFHSWADRLGYLTWAEAPSWGFDPDDPEGGGNFLAEWAEIVCQVRNHPSVVVWTPLNETGFGDGRNKPIGDAHRALVERAAKLTRAIDPTRPVNDASGWVHCDTDIWSVHNYEQNPDTLREMLAPFPDVFRNAPSGDIAYGGQPYILSEFGGAAYAENGAFAPGPAAVSEGWGYGAAPASADEFEARIRAQVGVALRTSHIRGYCYTQLTDVEQEQNGVLTADRQPKLPVATYRDIFGAEPEGEAT